LIFTAVIVITNISTVNTENNASESSMTRQAPELPNLINTIFRPLQWRLTTIQQQYNGEFALKN